MEQWLGPSDPQLLSLSISDAALKTSCDAIRGRRTAPRLQVGRRVSVLVGAVNAERIAGFPSGQLLLDSVEQALAAALLSGYAVGRRSVPTYRGGPAGGDPARLAFDEGGGLIVSLAKSRMSRPPEKKRGRELNP
jgi:hypothetical protein